MKRLIIPCYSPYPGPEWEVLFPHAADIAYVILNVDSGFGVGIDPVYVAMSERLKNAGVGRLGYVSSRYGARPIDEVKAEIALWFDHYHVDGIFADEMSSSADFLPYYRRVKSACGAAVLVANPGTVPDEAYRELDAIICVAETDQERYLEKTFPEWTKIVPDSVCHIVFSVTDAAKVMAKIDSNAAGCYVYLATTVPKPGSQGPEFNITDTIWPPSEATPAPLPAPLNTPENQAVMILIEVMSALQAASESTLKSAPWLVKQRMEEIAQLKSEVARLTTQGSLRLAAADDDQIIEDLKRRLANRRTI